MPKKKRRGNAEGALYQRSDGFWVGSVSLGHDLEGKRIRRTVYAKTKKEAKEKLLKLQQDALTGPPIRDDKITVDQHFQDWLNVKKGEVKKTTHLSYTRIYDKHIKPRFGHIRLKDLTYQKINALYSLMDDEGLSRRTVNYVCFILRSGLEDAVKKQLVINNQAKLAAGRKQDKVEARFLNQEEFKRFVSACEGVRLADAFILALHTGLRASEWMGLSWDNVDWENKTITVKQALLEESGEIWLDTVKSQAGRRMLKLSATAIKALKRQWKRQKEEELACPTEWKNVHNLVFTNTEGGPLRRSDVGKRDFKPVVEKAKLKDVTLHTLRHTHATILIYQGVDIKTISRRLGHADIAFSLQTYGHLLPGQDERAAEEMEVFAAKYL